MSPLTRTTSKAAGLVLAALTLVVSLLPALPAQAATTLAQISFGKADITPPAGYTVDSGQAYTAARGYGWVNLADGNPQDLTANTRYSWNKTQGYNTLIYMQTGGSAAGGRWEYAVPNGTYDVTVTAGDARSNDGVNYCCLDATNRITVEGVLAVNDYKATAAQPLITQTVTVAVTDGKITLDPIGGINTKFDRVVIATSTGTPQPVTPVITSVTPAQAATQVALNAAVSLGVSQPVDLTTVNAANFTLTGPGGVVAGNYNADAAGGTAAFTPNANLAVNTVYTVNVTSGLKAANGQPFAPFTSQFTTGTAPPPLASTAFTKRASVPVPKPNVLTIGPDNKVYVGTASGKLFRFDRAANGTLSNGENITPFGSRVITGLAFDPLDPTKLWVTHNYSGYTNAPRMSGHVSTLTIQAGQPLSADVASAADVIVGLPRSVHDHMTNGIAFGPDNKLYIAQGANTAYGAPDAYWGPRGEAPLTASILVADVHSSAAFPAASTLDVNTDVVGTVEDTGSDPAAGYQPVAGAPLTVYASGIRNPFTLLWGPNGSLYAPVNESASGGNTPSPASNNPPPATNVQAYTDYFTRIAPGKYYGHPNPAQGYYTLNGGNPTAQGDPYEVTEYPVGVQPDPNWAAPDFAMGVHRSPDGAAVYTSTSAFSGALKGKILVSEYSNGDDLVAVNLDGTGKPVSEAVLPDATNPGQALIFNNPLGLATDANGLVYVAEAQSETDPSAGLITLLAPGVDAVVNNGVHVNFQPASVTAPNGYSADTGAAFNGTSGWQDLNGAPLDLTANTRVRHSATSPDVRYDTQLIMQAFSGSGNTTPGQWVTTLPNGQYDVTVTVGDPTATNSVDEIVAQPGTADATTIIDHFAPTTGNYWSTQTKRVKVANGVLVLSPAGGTQTKIDFVDAVPAAADTLAPSVSLSLAGPQSGGSGSPYVGPVTVTATATDNVGVTSTTYVLDGAAATAYTGPVTVSAVGSHTITVTAKDAAGNPGTATATFSITSSAPTSLHVNFGTQTSAAPSGYVNDYGQAFSAATGSGWENAADGTPASLVGNGRERNSTLSPDKRYDTLVQLQQTAASSSGTLTPGQWEYTLANGDYNVTVAVGDATATNSVDRITAEPGTANAVVVINNFQAVAGTLFQTVTKRVTVSDGRLTLSPTGGSNTKIDFVDVVQAPPLVDSTAPTASIALAGTLVSGSTYSGTVTATVTAADEAQGTGLKSVTYSLDSGADTPYTSPVAVSGVGSHTLTVTATDNSNNVGTATKTWTINAPPPPDTTAPTASVALAGNLAGGVYTGDVTATVTSADEAGGSGVKTVTYTLDGGAVTPYTAPVVVHSAGSHTLNVTVTDNANNVGTASATWTSQLADTTAPTATVSLAGTVYSPGVYTGNVTATITAADDAGGSGVASVSYVLDGGPSTAYTAPVVVSTVGPHTLQVTVTDNQNNTGTASKSWTQQAPDTTAPTASIALSGSADVNGLYTGDVTATVTSADEAGGSGVKTVTYSLDGAAAKSYTGPITVTASGSHSITVTVTDNASNAGTASTAWNQQAAGTPHLTVTSPDNALLGLTAPRLVFSAVRGSAAPPARSFTFTNDGTSALNVSSLAIGGTNANNWKLAVGQATSVTIPAGGSVQVSIQFSPTDPTGCADSANPYAIGDALRNATLTFSTNDPAQATGSSLLSGVNSCYAGGNSEPVLDQLLSALGYTDVVDTQYIDRRYIGPNRWQANTDEIQSPYFKVADSTAPVSIVPIDHYGSANTSAYQSTGYYAAGSVMASNSTCSNACKSLWKFPADTVSAGVTTYNQNQKLLPGVTGVTTFQPAASAVFGIFSGDFSDVNFTDDSYNTGHSTSNVNLPVPHYLHDIRVYPAYGPGHVAIPNAYILAVDLSRVPAYKNNDFQDVVLLVRNVQPALAQGPVIGAATSTDLTTGGTVTASCAVTGFDGVLPNTGGTQCNAGNIAFGANGLTLTSTAGQLANSNQQNALYKTFDATRNGFTITARVLGPVTQLTNDYQQIGAWFGPDQANFIKVEAEHNGAGDPKLTMFYSEKGVSGTVASVSLPAMTTASTLDLIIKGNGDVPDPLPYGDPYGVHGFPLDELTVYYSLDGAAPVQVGTTYKSPADVTGWFSRQAKAGILVSNSGSTTPISATFTKFAITAP
ncbi:MAG: hypothetical protein QOJ11_2950 [Frankiales bacterium]|jgi:hypothetical protein|nr:hypothetical protein [Frankiales bacterium]